jgi:hypothetical protein
MTHGYLRTEIPLYAIDAARQAKWLQVHASTARPIAWEAVPADLQQSEADFKRRIDQVHEQLGEQSDTVRQTLAQHALFTRAGFDWHP